MYICNPTQSNCSTNLRLVGAICDFELSQSISSGQKLTGGVCTAVSRYVTTPDEDNLLNVTDNQSTSWTLVLLSFTIVPICLASIILFGLAKCQCRPSLFDSGKFTVNFSFVRGLDLHVPLQTCKRIKRCLQAWRMKSSLSHITKY